MADDKFSLWARQKLHSLCRWNPACADDLTQESEVVFLEIAAGAHRNVGMGKERFFVFRLNAVIKAVSSVDVSLFTPVGEEGDGSLIDMISDREIPSPIVGKRLKRAVTKFQRYRRANARRFQCVHCGRKLFDRSRKYCLVCRVKRCYRRLEKAAARGVQIKNGRIARLFYYQMGIDVEQDHVSCRHCCESLRPYGYTPAGYRRWICRTCQKVTVSKKSAG